MMTKKRKIENASVRDYLWDNTSLCPNTVAMVLEYLKPFIFRKKRIRKNMTRCIRWISEDRICIHGELIKLEKERNVFRQRFCLLPYFTGDPNEKSRIIKNGIFHFFDDSICGGEFQDEFFMCFLDFKILLQNLSRSGESESLDERRFVSLTFKK
jgi:hypothetical protein